MAQTKVYTLEAFIEDVRQVFASSRDPRAQAQGIAKHLATLLKVPRWLEEKLKAAPEASGRVDLHLDTQRGHPEPCFMVMAGRQQQSFTPHDHGAGFVVYGVYQGASEHRKYRWVYPPGQYTSPQLHETELFILKPGEAAFFLPGEIHGTRAAEPGTIIMRVESQDMDRLWRHRYDLEGNSAIAYKG